MLAFNAISLIGLSVSMPPLALAASQGKEALQQPRKLAKLSPQSVDCGLTLEAATHTSVAASVRTLAVARARARAFSRVHVRV